jgi:hypothetical protein
MIYEQGVPSRFVSSPLRPPSPMSTHLLSDALPPILTHSTHSSAEDHTVTSEAALHRVVLQRPFGHASILFSKGGDGLPTCYDAWTSRARAVRHPFHSTA